jgi:hypothetical protein
MACALPFSVVLWTAQNVWSEKRRCIFEEFNQRAQQGDEEAQAWVQHFLALGEKLKVRVTGCSKTQTIQNG